jgi:hypothetical protein
MVTTDAEQLKQAYQIVLFIMQQYYASNPTGWSEAGSAKASEKYSTVHTAFHVNEPSQSELHSLRGSLRPFLRQRLEADWASKARGTDQVGGERIDVSVIPGSVIVSVQVPIRRYEAVYQDAQGRPLQYPVTQSSEFTVQAQAKSVLQNGVWTGIQQ